MVCSIQLLINWFQYMYNVRKAFCVQWSFALVVETGELCIP